VLRTLQTKEASLNLIDGDRFPTFTGHSVSFTQFGID